MKTFGKPENQAKDLIESYQKRDNMKIGYNGRENTFTLYLYTEGHFSGMGLKGRQCMILRQTYACCEGITTRQIPSTRKANPARTTELEQPKMSKTLGNIHVMFNK